jgi:hypothetical protein
VWTEKTTRVEEFPGIVPFEGEMESQPVAAGSACHEREPPPVLEIVTD